MLTSMSSFSANLFQISGKFCISVASSIALCLLYINPEKQIIEKHPVNFKRAEIKSLLDDNKINNIMTFGKI